MLIGTLWVGSVATPLDAALNGPRGRASTIFEDVPAQQSGQDNLHLRPGRRAGMGAEPDAPHPTQERAGRLVFRTAAVRFFPADGSRTAPGFYSRLRGVEAGGVRFCPPKSQKTAIGFNGEPVPPRIGSGAAIKRNSHRSLSAAASASASRSQLSSMWTPR